MPELSRFFGIIVTINYNDHPPPHFHVRYGEQKALIEIATLRMLEGKLSPRLAWCSNGPHGTNRNWTTHGVVPVNNNH